VKTVRLTLEEDLVRAVDRAARGLKTTRSGFTRRALRDALARLAVARLEDQHRRGDVRWYRFPQPDKRCPVLVLTREDGMSHSYAVNCDHLQTVVQARVGSLITTLSAERMVEVARAVSFALRISPTAPARRRVARRAWGGT